MEIRHLRYFIVAAREEHFHRAAERLGIPQPSLTRHVQNLERSLGFRLFDRLPRGVRLSAAGRAFWPKAEEAIENLGQAKEYAARVAAGAVGSLAVGYSEVAAWHPLVLKAFSEFRRREPLIDLALEAGASWPLLEKLRSGAIDTAFVFHGCNDEREFGRLAVDSDRLVVALSRAHPLAKRKRLAMKDLQGAPFVWMPRQINPALYDELVSAMTSRGLRPNFIQESASIETLLSYVAQGIAYSVMPAGVARHKLSDVLLRPLDGLTVQMTLTLVWRRPVGSAPLRKFIKLLSGLAKPGRAAA